MTGSDPPPPDDTGLVRLQKLLASSGVASRRRCEQLMLAGRVEVDGEVVTRLGTRIDPRTAVVRVDGARLPPLTDTAYLALNKPVGVLSTMSDPQGRPTLADLVAGRPERLFHVGRLDADTSGLLLLTNDGEVAHRLAHPSYELSKTYVAQVSGAVRPSVIRRLLAGVELDDGTARADRVTVRETHAGRSIVEVVLHEGRNRIVRRMLDAVGHPVQSLTRTAFGPVRLGTQRAGTLRELSRDELGSLLDAVGL
ncbi:MAG: rRNA pseudouridine synthase [Nocardioidaceae bacterium]|nr:rRNA pseudouridine synthase [Nocardioidaceae bacterium]MDQ3166618.1 rRNA pseudouridine synthase [Actinomycetota bacterium]